jgi:IstB-like ATP binding protein
VLDRDGKFRITIPERIEVSAQVGWKRTGDRPATASADGGATREPLAPLRDDWSRPGSAPADPSASGCRRGRHATVRLFARRMRASAGIRSRSSLVRRRRHIGIRACLAGHRVAFRTATEWVALLADAQRHGRLDDELTRLQRIPLLIVDDRRPRR